MKNLKEITAYKNTVKERVLKDADGDIEYIETIANHGCVGGSCRNLIYYKDTHAFYEKYANDIDDILLKIEEEIGEPYNITENMHRLGQSDLRNFLSWLAYEVTAQNILKELEDEE